MNKNESKYFNTALKMNDALISLLEKKDFEYITIKDICSKAKVNRSTFYLHYTNTYDLLEEVIDGLNKSFNDHLKTDESVESILNSKNLDDLYLIKDQFLIPYLSFIKDNLKIYKAVRCNQNLFNTNKVYEKMFSSVFSPILNRFGLEEKWHKYVMDFYINGISSLILDWVNNNCCDDIFELCDLIKGLIVKNSK
jgi:AcrR family transcriptional regulator